MKIIEKTMVKKKGTRLISDPNDEIEKTEHFLQKSICHNNRFLINQWLNDK